LHHSLASHPSMSSGGRGRPKRPSDENTGSSGRRSKDAVQSRKPKDATGRRVGSRPLGDETKWQVSKKAETQRRLTDKELLTARTLFFQLDTDGSGSIDVEELGVMMRQLGQSPTEQELKDLIASVDDSPDGDSDGKIQLREFLKLYSGGLDNAQKAGLADVNDCFSAMGGDPKDPAASLSCDTVFDFLRNEYNLDVDFGETFGTSQPQLSKGDFETLILSARENAARG